MGTPRASKTSADPQREVTARLPCLATSAPAAAATRAAPVEMLKVAGPPPPVPQVLTSRARSSSVKRDGRGAGAHLFDKAGKLGGELAAGGEDGEQGGGFDFWNLARRG